MDLGTKEQKIHALETILGELVKSMRNAFMYPPGHPSLKKSYESTYHFFQDFLKDAGELTITSVKEGINYEDVPLPREAEALKKLSQDLTHKNIFRITFKGAMTLTEFENFTSLISIDSKKFRELGGAVALFSKNDLKNIAVKEMEFDNLLADGGSGERDGAEELETIDTAGDISGDAKHPALKLPEQDQAKEEDELAKEIDHYLALLSKETNPDRFKKILFALIRLAENLSKEGKTDYLMRIIIGLTHQTLIVGKRPETFAKLCVSAIRKCPLAPIMDLAVTGLTSREESIRKIYLRLIRIIGDDAVEPIIMRLIDSQDSQERRILINALVAFGEIARPKTEIYLFDERWYVVRNMASILGEIKSEKSLNPLSRAVTHKDIRVQREIVKALTRIGGKRVSTFFLRLLTEAPEQFALIIINALGILGDTSATEQLTAIVTKRDPLHKNYEIRKEAITALAKLKDPEAVETLGKIMLKKELFGGARYEDLRLSAARALGRIGGAQSADLLTKGANLRNKNVKKAAQAALQAIGNSQ